MSRSEAVLFAAVLLAPGCAWITQNHAATAEYSRQVDIVSLRAAELEEQLAEADKRIAQLEETVRLHGQQEATRLENLDQVNTEINRLRGQIEEVRFQLEEMQRFLDDGAIERERRMLHAERRLGELEKFLRVKPPPPPTDEELGIARAGDPGSATGDGSAGTGTGQPGDGALATGGGAGGTGEPEVVTPATAEEKLELAVEHMSAGRQGVARALLEKALEEHPGAAETAEIRYRIGETWFNEGDYKKAITAWKGVTDNHDKSEWASWAMLRQGEAFEKLGNADGAKLFWEGVVDKYPRTQAAKEAKQKLAGK